MILLGVCAVLYTARLLFFWIGVIRHGRHVPDPERPLPRTSVIVPARNEERNVVRCIHALMASDMPANLFEVVVVDDRSTDGTGSVLDGLAAHYPALRVVHRTPADVHANLKGKPGALDHGIGLATGDVILMTDADCAVHPSWVRTMASACAVEGVGMVCGFTTVRSERFLDTVQDVEWTFTQSMARAGVGNGIPLGCFGNNIGVRKHIYDSLGGYTAIPFSITEDLALLQAVHRAGYSVQYICEPMATVETLPCVTLMEYVRQKHRWARGGTALGGVATTFVGASIALWVGLVSSAMLEQWSWFWLFAAMRFIGDTSFISYVLVRLGRTYRIVNVVPALLMLFWTELALPFLVLRTKVVWKGQVFGGR